MVSPRSRPKTKKQVDGLKLKNESVQLIPWDEIKPFPDQPRKYFDPVALEQLAASIALIGQQTPIVIRRIPPRGRFRYQLVDGQRRWHGCKMAHVPRMRAYIRVIKDEEEQFLISVISNFGREEHLPLEIARAIDRLNSSKKLERISPGERIAYIASVFVKSTAWVYQHMGLLRLDPEVQALMSPEISEEKRLKTAAALFISSLQPGLQIKVAKRMVSEEMNINQARFFARQVAAEAGVTVGRSTRDNSSDNDFRSLRRFAANLEQQLERLNHPIFLGTLLKRNPSDRQKLSAGLETSAGNLLKLSQALVSDLA